MYRYRVVFVKEGEFACLSHLDLQRTFIRVLRRAGLPLAYSQGFNPQPRLSFAAPLAVGISGEREYLEFDLVSPRESKKIKDLLNSFLPRELAVQSVEQTDAAAIILASRVEAALYLAVISPPVPDLAAAVRSMMSSPVLEVERQGKSSKKRLDIRPFIYNLYLQNTNEEDKLFMFLATGNQGGARPAEVLELLPLQEATALVRRLTIFVDGENEYLTPRGESLSHFLDVGSQR